VAAVKAGAACHEDAARQLKVCRPLSPAFYKTSAVPSSEQRINMCRVHTTDTALPYENRDLLALGRLCRAAIRGDSIEAAPIRDSNRSSHGAQSSSCSVRASSISVPRIATTTLGQMHLAGSIPHARPTRFPGYPLVPLV